MESVVTKYASLKHHHSQKMIEKLPWVNTQTLAVLLFFSIEWEGCKCYHQGKVRNGATSGHYLDMLSST